MLAAKDVKYFYVTIPSQSHGQADLQADGTRRVRPDGVDRDLDGSGRLSRSGLVNFKVLVKTESKRIGQFVQMPVATSQLTISTSPQTTLADGPAAKQRCGVRP